MGHGLSVIPNFFFVYMTPTILLWRFAFLIWYNMYDTISLRGYSSSSPDLSKHFKDLSKTFQTLASFNNRDNLSSRLHELIMPRHLRKWIDALISWFGTLVRWFGTLVVVILYLSFMIRHHERRYNEKETACFGTLVKIMVASMRQILFMICLWK